MGMKGLRLKESCLYARDLDKMRAFYEGVLGLEVISHVEGSHVFFRAGDAVLLCFDPEASARKKEPPPHHGKGELHIAFELDEAELEDWQQRIRNKGIPIEQVQDWHGGRKRSFYFRDPERNLVEILEKGIWDMK
jgi:catechol 2,3-dioxygenase-like lactoylglutathione lyase family enzyme